MNKPPSARYALRPPTRQEHAALRRALDLASLTLAHAECIALALRRAKPAALRRDIKRLRAALDASRAPD